MPNLLAGAVFLISYFGCLVMAFKQRYNLVFFSILIENQNVKKKLPATIHNKGVFGRAPAPQK
jgi:hypothetical protein